MQGVDEKPCGCEDKKEEMRAEKGCDCGGRCGSGKKDSSETLASRKERLEQELKEVNERLEKE